MNNQNKFKLGKNTLVLSLLTLITILSWIFFEAYRTINKNTISKTTQEQMNPLNPTLNIKIINELKNKSFLDEAELNIFTAPEPKPESEKILEEPINEESISTENAQTTPTQ